MARVMKDSGVEWIGEIPHNWIVGPVKRLFFRKNEKAMLDDPIVLSLARSGVKVRDISNNEGQLAESYFNYNPVKPGDLLLNPMDLYSGANCSISYVDGVISPAYINLGSKPEVSSRYYDYYFKTQYWAMALFAHGKGVSFENRWTLGQETLMSYILPIPSYHEQQRIASFLDSKCKEIDNVLAKTRSSIEEYKKLKQAIITKAVTKGIRKNRKMKDSGIEWIGEIPEEWEIRTLGNVTLSLRNGYVGPTKDLFVETGIKYIQSLHIKDGNIEFNKHPYYVTETWVSNRPRIHTNDLLIVQTGDIGNVGLVNKEYDNCGCHALIIASINSSIMMPRFLMYYLLSIPGKELLLQKKTGALLPHLNSGKIKSCSICCPMIAEQTAVINYLDDNCSRINTIIQKKEQLLSELESYKKSLIYEYVTGKKEVPMA